jgi:hypothetical protein
MTSVPFKWIYRFNTIPTKVLPELLKNRNGQVGSKISMENVGN